MKNSPNHPSDKDNIENCAEKNEINFFDRKAKSDKKLETRGKTNFEKKIRKMFDRKKFKLSHKFNQKNSEIFLKDKDECMKDVELDDTIPDNLDESLCSKIKKKHNKLSSFCSIESLNYIKEIVDLLK